MTDSSKTSPWRPESRRWDCRLRVALIREIVSCRMYSTLGQLVRGWSRIFYDALDRRPGRLLLKLLDPLIFCQTGHLALAAAVLLLALGRSPNVRTLAAGPERDPPRVDVRCVPPRLRTVGPEFQRCGLVPARQPAHRPHHDQSHPYVFDRPRQLERYRLRIRRGFGLEENRLACPE